jgi:hypothetical protein
VESSQGNLRGRTYKKKCKPYALFVSTGWALKICNLNSLSIDKTETWVHFSGFIQVLEFPGRRLRKRNQ